MKFAEIASVDVSAHVEKKANLSYLSWAWAIDQLARMDDASSFEILPDEVFGDGTRMVWVEVSAFGKTKKMFLPVMDNRNKAIANPDARAVSDSRMRCLVKCIALFGLGLYIYAGEDIPRPDTEIPKPASVVKAEADLMAKEKAELGEAYREAVAAVGDSASVLRLLGERLGTSIAGAKDIKPEDFGLAIGHLRNIAAEVSK